MQESAAGGCRILSVLDVGQGPEAESFLMFGSCGLSQLPSGAPVTGNRSKTVPGRQAEVRRKGVRGRVHQGLGRKLGLATFRAL